MAGSPYDMLAVREDATAEEIKASYERLLRANASDPNQIKRLQWAYSVVANANGQPRRMEATTNGTAEGPPTAAENSGQVAKLIAEFRKLGLVKQGIVIVFFVSLFQVVFKTPPSQGETAARECKSESGARAWAQQAVENRLKSPTTADFSSSDDTQAGALGDCKFRVVGYVDAQNSFGAKIRSRYDVVVQYDMGGRQWRVLSTDIH